MDLYFVTDARFHRGKDGNIYAGEMSFNNQLYERYLKKFDKVYIVARLFEAMDDIPAEHIVTNAEVLPLPAFNSAWEFLKNKKTVRNKLQSYLKREGAVMIRGAGAVGYLASEVCTRHGISYGIEVIGDPYDVFAPGVIKHPLRFLFRYLFTYQQKRAVYNACAVLYVTKFALQNRYPERKGVFSSYASNVYISEKQNVKSKKLTHKETYTMISVGALEQMYKAPDIAIRVIAEMNKRGFSVELKWLGAGKYMQDMKALSEELGVASLVDFVGSVTREEVDRYLEQSDVFLLLSRTEGLPRAMVEAMAMALPCIGTNVGGIPELLDRAFLVPVDHVEVVCEKLRLLLQNSEIYSNQSLVNLQTAKEYHTEYLDERRASFYEAVKRFTLDNDIKR